MESMHEIVELKRINLATIPPIELRAKVAQRLAQVAIVSDPRPFSHQAFDPFRDVRHHHIGLSDEHGIGETVHLSGSPFTGVRALWESRGFPRWNVAIQVKSRRLSVSSPGLLKRPYRFFRSHAEASQCEDRGAHAVVGIGATADVPPRGTPEDRLAMWRVDRMRPRRRRCCTVSGNH